MDTSNGNEIFTTEPLVRGNITGRSSESNKHDNNTSDDVVSVLSSNVPLSFWGGIDELTGEIIDTSHPLHGKCVSNTILCLPSGRGSCTASQVLMELLLNGRAPRALVLRDRDGLLCVGALIAQTVFRHHTILDILQVDSAASTAAANFDALIEQQPKFGSITSDGTLLIGDTEEAVTERIHDYQSNSNHEQENVSNNLQDDDDGDISSWSPEEQEMFKNAQSDAEKRAVECLVKYARIVSPSNDDDQENRYVEVEQAHIDGCTYIGPGGLAFVQQLVQEGGRVKIPTTLNSVSTDLRFWKQLGILPTESQQNSIALADAYVALGCSPNSFTCAPYLLETAPMKDQQIVWGESNAVVYANTVLGARTEKYADYLDICCAIVGKVPAVGVHLEEHRKPTILLDMEEVEISADNAEVFQGLFPVLGHLCGSLSDGEVPLLVGLDRFRDDITTDHLKAFCAAFGTTAASPLIHIAGITPEATSQDDIAELMKSCARRNVTIRSEDLDDTFRLLDQQATEEDFATASSNGNDEKDPKIDWIALGNPHLSLSECDELLDLMVKRQEQPQAKVHDNVTIIACISRALYDQSTSVNPMEAMGVTFVRDTCWCMLLHPPMIPSDPTATILTNSGKYAHYGPGLTGRKFRFGTMNDCVEAAWTGMLPRRSSFAVAGVPWATSTRTYSTKVEWNHHFLSSCTNNRTTTKRTSDKNVQQHLRSAFRLLRTFK